TTEDRYLVLLDNIPHSLQVRVEGVSIVQNNTGSYRQAAHHPVPHHPARRGNVGYAVGLLHIRMQHSLLELVYQDPGRPLHHALRLPSRARGEHDVDWVIGWQLLESSLAQFQLGEVVERN